MRILLCSTWFAPSFGGVETISKILAEEFTRAGHSVVVVTSSPGPSGLEIGVPYSIVRQPSQMTLAKLARNSDALLQNMISLRTLVPLLISGKPVIVTHHSWLRRNNGSKGPENYAKLLALRFCHNLSISRAIANTLPVRSEVIGNPFEANEFAHLRVGDRDRDIVFLGRLVSDKGCSLLLHALGELKGRGLTPTATIIGDGPEMPNLKVLVKQFSLEKQVEFKGAMREGRGEVVARHRIMAIPSIWAEPFGVVALEGIASGCALVASSEGGLSEAGGPCGLYFPNHDVSAMAARLERLLTDAALCESLVAAGPNHLKQFQPGTVAARYLTIFEQLIR